MRGPGVPSEVGAHLAAVSGWGRAGEPAGSLSPSFLSPGLSSLFIATTVTPLAPPPPKAGSVALAQVWIKGLSSSTAEIGMFSKKTLLNIKIKQHGNNNEKMQALKPGLGENGQLLLTLQGFSFAK